MTLACEDGTQVETHKVILASSSPFFMEILKRNKHPHPMIYMRGVKADELLAIVDFLYFGEANVNQESLDSFLGLAEELKLKGLTGSAECNDEEYVTKIDPENKVSRRQRQTESTSNLPNPLNISNPNANETIAQVALVSVEAQQLDKQIKSMMNTSENVMTTGNHTRRAWICNVCGKEGQWANVKTHIEANHIVSNVSHSCDICGKISRSRNGLRLHKAKEHCT